MLTLYTGRNRTLASALIAALKAVPEAETQLIVVPKQLTLQTERMLLEALQLRGSFALQVLSAERLCARIFDHTGQPEGIRIDERGRVMLVRNAIRAAAPLLTVYRGAERRRGFPERAAKQLERIRQASLTPETLRACAAELNGAAAMKLNDLSHILEAYQSLIDGHYQDGETEFQAAIAQMGMVDFLRTSNVWFFGFDMMPPTLHALIAAVAAQCPHTALFLPLENDEQARDFDNFLPIQRAFNRLVHAAQLAGTTVQRIFVEEASLSSQTHHRSTLLVSPPPQHADLRQLERELFAFPAKTASGRTPKGIQMSLLRNPAEECMFAAALVRRLAYQRGYRYGDVLILCRDIEGYSQPLRTAFAAYGVPLVLSSSRSAARHATAECLLTALRVIEKGYPAEDMLALLHTNMMPIQGDEAERLSNYTIRTGLRGSRFLRPLRRGSEAEIAEMEPLRARFAMPLIHLRDRLRRAETLQAQLTALFDFLTEIDAYGKGLARQQQLIDAGLRTLAGEESQVWNRILGALDQMEALMGNEPLSIAELRETLSESLSAAVIKPLPQSGDAVYAQSSERACTQSARAILLLGATDRPVSDDEGLLTPAQKQALSSFASAYLGPDGADLSRLRRFYMKSALGMATEYVSISCPLSALDGAAQRPSTMFEFIGNLFPGLRVRGGLSGDPSVERMLRASPTAAISFAAKALAEASEGMPAPSIDRAALSGLLRIAKASNTATPPNDVHIGLRQLSTALNCGQSADMLRTDTAHALYGTIHRQSITQLELFAACPFAYFVRYGLHPERIEPFALNARDEGTFFHSAVNEFLLRSMDDLNTLDIELAELRMDAIADMLLDAMGTSGPLGDSAVSLAERHRLKATARTCAAALTDHMRDSRFHTIALEQNFGREDGLSSLQLSGGCTLEGRIDRVDAWNEFVRVIDYKRGGKAVDLCELYYGLRLQLPVYLAAALRKRDARSAGVFYFTLNEGILATQSIDRHQIEADRRKAFRMEGLLPDDTELLQAMSPHFPDVLKARVTTTGALYKGTLCTDEKGFQSITAHALQKAEDHVERIRTGDVGVTPIRLNKLNPCAYCDMHTMCLFDEQLDAAHMRKLKPINNDEVFLRLSIQKEERKL